jgi:catechol 2,3-dioxygenase-like lactoylglutathione lyase family enzyme
MKQLSFKAINDLNEGGENMKRVISVMVMVGFVVVFVALSGVASAGDYRGIHHIGVTVSNLERSVAFYRDVMGFKLLVPPTGVFSGPDLERGIGVPGAKLRLAVFEVDRNHRMEVLEYLSPASALQRPLPPNTLGAMHIAFHVSDAPAKMKELRSKGVTFFSELNLIEEGPLKGWKWVYFHDPDGNTLEMVEDHSPVTNP